MELEMMIAAGCLSAGAFFGAMQTIYELPLLRRDLENDYDPEDISETRQFYLNYESVRKKLGIDVYTPEVQEDNTNNICLVLGVSIAVAGLARYDSVVKSFSGAIITAGSLKVGIELGRALAVWYYCRKPDTNQG